MGTGCLSASGKDVHCTMTFSVDLLIEKLLIFRLATCHVNFGSREKHGKYNLRTGMVSFFQLKQSIQTFHSLFIVIVAHLM